MGSSRIDRLLETLASTQFLWWLLWAGLAFLTLALLVLMRTRWGHSKPLSKCLALSLLAHLLMVGYATTLRIVETTAGPGLGPEHGPIVRVSTVDIESPQAQDEHGDAQRPHEARPWEVLSAEPAPPSSLPEIARPQAPPVEADEPELRDAQSPPIEAPLAEASPAKEEDAPAQLPSESARPAMPPTQPATAMDTIAAQRADAPSLDLAAPAGPDRVQSAAIPAPELPRLATSTDAAATVGQPAPLPQTVQPLLSVEPEASLAGLVDVTNRPARPVPARQEQSGQSEGSPSGSLTGTQDDGASQSDQRPLVQVSKPRPGDPPLAGLAQPALGTTGEQQPAPIYSERTAPDRARFAAEHGGGADTEAAVNAALKWLAGHQSLDGRWEAMRFGAGRENRVGGEDRKGAGAHADTGVTGLALLAFLGAGHTHKTGAHQDTVRRGLDYLIAAQAADGSLTGKAEVFAAMYCHGMAALALGEALGMTGDKERLAAPFRRAVAYTLSVQHPTTGGWRYRKAELGDTSQLGWQLMVLKSAELAGLPIPQRTHEGMIRFLRSVASGTYQGLASYRPNEKASRSMTAEALVCRQFLGMAHDNPAGEEAASYLMQELPAAGQTNLYYWYYATLGTYQLQGEHWRRWNEALKGTLLRKQRTDGDWAGSWDTDDVWGGHGGRVYTTAMAALCLEVYYRFLPLYGQPLARKPAN